MPIQCPSGLRPILNVLHARPISAVFEVCLRCNSDCGYCNLPLNVGRYEMTRREIQRVFKTLYQSGLRFVFVQGGEPLLRKDLPDVPSCEGHLMRRSRASAFLCLAVSALVACSTVPKSFNPDRPIIPQEVSHRVLDDLVRTHVKDGVVDYPAIAADGRLHTYLGQLNRVDPNALPTRDARLAFWINAYNAFAIKGILDGYSPMTLVGRYRYFIARDYEVGGQEINLYDLERKLLIPRFREPRIHFAIVCASRSCPKLQGRAFSPDRLHEQLDEAARGFVNDPSRNSFDRERKVARLSMIFKWFRSDFEAAAGSLPAYVSRYVTDEVLGGELASGAYTITFLDYDWSLNGPPPESGKGQVKTEAQMSAHRIHLSPRLNSISTF